ncbi:MAG: RdgB/HAM1 family non-canonical purine NTP pyrophosphatase [Paramuribaculum sp.]|nr:RdgB/HAM1 family non-canonical purine NTP pyrophosphatase [Paramuribaculum sp.]MDE6303415.1 RdgB/HAM1 family non-canonical purine NTP pyrophosphatase [Paramuribaculum sp.]
MAKKVLVMATNNSHKLKELREIVDGEVEILSLQDINFHDDIPETCDTLEGNALQKARWIKDRYGYDCLADDTGLMVDALNGAPGVYSARYAGEGHDSAANTRKLLANLEGADSRRAHFSTYIALLIDNDCHIFEGRVDGEISLQPTGEGGFGYDPVFVPDEGGGKSFAEMSGEDKNLISHRGRAVRKLVEFLHTLDR